MIMRDQLSEQLYQWDGTHMEPLSTLYTNHRQDPLFMDTLIQLYRNDLQLQIGTTWLLKHHYDKGNKLSEKQITEILLMSEKLSLWEARLHILQLIPKFNLTSRMVPLFEWFVRAAINDQKKFVKAAAYQAYSVLIDFKPELKEDFKAQCIHALEHESASVVSKVRKILKQLEA